MKRKWLRRVFLPLLLLMGVLFGINLWVPLPGNPPQRYQGVILSNDADQVLRRACFDCHSNETVYPWYTSLPGVGGVVGYHVRAGREELNFSQWEDLSSRKRGKAISESLEEIREGEMPQVGYPLLHPGAVLSGEDIALLERTAVQAYGGGVLTHAEDSEDDDDDDDERHEEKDDD